MNSKKKETDLLSTSNISHIASKMKRRTSLSIRFDLCTCQPLAEKRSEEDFVWEEMSGGEQMVPVSQALYARVHALLHGFFPRVEPLSLLVLHMSQLESKPLAPHSNLLYKRRRYHAPPGLLEQVLAKVQRVIRVEDKLLLDEDIGFALVFPGVDQQGVEMILERVYSSICLLQAETLIPPLTRETTITVGIGSYPTPSLSLDTFYQQVDRVARSLVLRPVITTQLQGVKPIPSPDDARSITKVEQDETGVNAEPVGVPFMHLPYALPVRLTQLLPFDIAVELRCAPVGRDQHCLTVAMLDPTDDTALRRLHNVTGMTIFPVSCEESALSSLLAQPW